MPLPHEDVAERQPPEPERSTSTSHSEAARSDENLTPVVRIEISASVVPPTQESRVPDARVEPSDAVRFAWMTDAARAAIPEAADTRPVESVARRTPPEPDSDREAPPHTTAEHQAELEHAQQLLGAERAALERRRCEIADLETALSERIRQLDEREAQLDSREVELETEIVLRDDKLTRREHELAELEQRLARKESNLAALVGEMQDKLSPRRDESFVR